MATQLMGAACNVCKKLRGEPILEEITLLTTHALVRLPGSKRNR